MSDRTVGIAIVLVCLAAAPASGASADQCLAILNDALKDPSPWVRVHAAEALVRLKHPEPAAAAFQPDAESTKPQYRIVVWRVLAAAEADPATRRRYIERIRAALLDPQSTDHTHAMESLAKLHEPAADDAERNRIREVADARSPASPFALWRLAQAKDADAIVQLLTLLQSNDATTCSRAAYVLGQLHPRPPETDRALQIALANQPPDSPARPMIRAAMGKAEARQLARDASAAPAGRYFAAMRLADSGSADDRPILDELVKDPDPDVRVAAAYAKLAIDARAGNSPTTQPR